MYNDTVKQLDIDGLKAKAKREHYMCEPLQRDAFEILRKNKKGLENIVEFMINELGMPASDIIVQIYDGVPKQFVKDLEKARVGTASPPAPARLGQRTVLILS